MDSSVYANNVGYRPEIDGIRAFAVLPVIFFHYGFAGFSGGYVGVDVFFVISGYLITGILLRDCDRPGSVLLRFWERRARRILPALFFMLAVITALAVVLYLPLELRRYGQELLSQAVFSSNILFFIKSGDYFHPVAETRTLLHTWSLSVEEQFYVLYPLMFLGFLKFGIKPLLFALVVFTTGSFLLSAATVGAYKSANYYLLPFRAWELGLGCCLALVRVPRLPGWVTEMLAGLGLAMILGAVALLDSKTPFPGSAALLPCMGTALLLAFGDKSNWTGALLKIPAMVGVGRISYSLYLWHWPLLVTVTTTTLRSPELGGKVAILLATFCMAWISWRFVETPFRTHKLISTGRPLLAFSMGVLMMLLITGSAFHLTGGLPARWPHRVVDFAAAELDRNPTRGKCRNLAPTVISAGKLCMLGPRKLENERRLLVWGDSHADAFMPGLEQEAERHSVHGWQAARVACGPILGLAWSDSECALHNRAVFEFIQSSKVTDVLLVARWSKLRGDERQNILAFSQMVDVLNKAGVEVWFLRQVPEATFPVPQTLARSAASGNLISDIVIPYSAYSVVRKTEDKFLAAAIVDPLRVLDPAVVLCKGNEICQVQAEDRALYFDDQHLSAFGAMYLAPALVDSFFQKIGRRSNLDNS